MAKYKRQYNTDTNKFEDNPNVGKFTPASNTRKKMKQEAKAKVAKAVKDAKSVKEKKKSAPKANAPTPRSREDRAKAKKSIVNVKLPSKKSEKPSRVDTGQRRAAKSGNGDKKPAILNITVGSGKKGGLKNNGRPAGFTNKKYKGPFK